MTSDDLVRLIEKWGKYIGLLAAIAGLINLAVNNKVVAFVLLTIGCALLEFWFWTMWRQSVYMRKVILKGEPSPSKIYTDKQRKTGQVFFFLTPFAYIVLLVFMMSANLPAALNPTPFPASATLTTVPTNTLIPTITPITAGAPPCLIDMENDLIFADLNEIYAEIRNGALEIEPRFSRSLYSIRQRLQAFKLFHYCGYNKIRVGQSSKRFLCCFWS